MTICYDGVNGTRAVIVFSATTLFALYVVALEGLPSVLVGEFTQELQLDTSRFGLFASAFFWTYLPGQVAGGLLVDRFGARWLVSGAAILAGAATAALAWTHDLSTAIALRMICGLASAMAVPAALMLAAEWFSPRGFLFAAPLFEGLAFAGGAVCQLSVPTLIRFLGEGPALVVTGLVGSALAVLLVNIVRQGPRRSPTGADTINLESVRGIFRLRSVWVLGVAGGLGAAFVAGFVASWAPGFLEARLGMSLTDAGRVSALGFAGLACGAPLWGALGSRTGSPDKCMALGLAITGITAGLLLEGPLWSAEAAGVLLFVTGAASGAFALAYPLVEASTSPHQRGVALGLTNLLLMGVGTVVLTPAVGFSLAYLYGTAKRHAPTVIAGPPLLDDRYSVAFGNVAWLYVAAPLAGALVILWWRSKPPSSNPQPGRPGGSRSSRRL